MEKQTGVRPKGMYGYSTDELRLEITMSVITSYGAHNYIRRSFPAKEGVINLYKYGYPYSYYRQIEIVKFTDSYSKAELLFGGKSVVASLNEFTTVKLERDNSPVVIDPYLKIPRPAGNDEIYTTFYLYVE